MARPTDSDIRSFLEGYGVDTVKVTKTWIDDRIANNIIPYVKKVTRMDFEAVQTVTEYYDGNGTALLMLNRKPIVAITEIQYVMSGTNLFVLNLQNIQLIPATGVLKAKRTYEEANRLPVFAKGDKNIKVTYTYGYTDYPADIKEAVIYLASNQVLGMIASRTGGGSVSIQGYSRNYGNRGMYTELRNDLSNMAHTILSRYRTSVIGG